MEENKTALVCLLTEKPHVLISEGKERLVQISKELQINKLILLPRVD